MSALERRAQPSCSSPLWSGALAEVGTQESGGMQLLAGLG